MVMIFSWFYRYILDIIYLFHGSIIQELGHLEVTTLTTSAFMIQDLTMSTLKMRLKRKIFFKIMMMEKSLPARAMLSKWTSTFKRFILVHYMRTFLFRVSSIFSFPKLAFLVHQAPNILFIAVWQISWTLYNFTTRNNRMSAGRKAHHTYIAI